MKSHLSLGLLSYCWNRHDIRLLTLKALPAITLQPAASIELKALRAPQWSLSSKLPLNLQGAQTDCLVEAPNVLGFLNQDSSRGAAKIKSRNTANSTRHKLQSLVQGECADFMVRWPERAKSDFDAWREDEKDAPQSGSHFHPGEYNSMPAVYDEEDEDEDHPLMIDLTLYEQHSQPKQLSHETTTSMRRRHSAHSLGDSNVPLASTTGRSEGE
jgi:hypothetical protein